MQLLRIAEESFERVAETTFANESFKNAKTCNTVEVRHLGPCSKHDGGDPRFRRVGGQERLS